MRQHVSLRLVELLLITQLFVRNIKSQTLPVSKRSSFVILSGVWFKYASVSATL